ncbi:hypothetical protein HHK36_012916 [Tetracentron sinense]|uniref:Uncharacterized protein n=1 Tax=Tetracentron sinense TaxID=13715 RepID=A0A834ZA78_TETSI|nr:hypothetical protein HHK36_012916 [Tetracentron sinense]
MGCFLPCFGSSKERKKRRKSAKRVLPRDQRNGSYETLQPTASLKQDSTENPISPVLEIKDKPEEQLSFNTRKKVTFDLNVNTYEEITTHEIKDFVSEIEEEKEGGKKEEKTEKTSQSSSLCQGESSESFFSLSVESRARISTTSTAEKEVNSPVPLPGSPDWELKTIGSNWNARDRSKYVHSVLNPVENLAQWKAVKTRAITPLKHQKENGNFEQEPQIPFSSEPSFKLSPFKSELNSNFSKPPNEDISVDTSLSNWLVLPKTTPTTKTSSISVGTMSSEKSTLQRSNSPRSHEDRPILGALTVEELKQFSASSSPRRSLSRNPDIPILGTVGSYWSHTGQAIDSSSGSSCTGIPNTTSKYRELWASALQTQTVKDTEVCIKDTECFPLLQLFKMQFEMSHHFQMYVGEAGLITANNSNIAKSKQDRGANKTEAKEYLPLHSAWQLSKVVC